MEVEWCLGELDVGEALWCRVGLVGRGASRPELTARFENRVLKIEKVAHMHGGW